MHTFPWGVVEPKYIISTTAYDTIQPINTSWIEQVTHFEEKKK